MATDVLLVRRVRVTDPSGGGVDQTETVRATISVQDSVTLFEAPANYGYVNYGHWVVCELPKDNSTPPDGAGQEE